MKRRLYKYVDSIEHAEALMSGKVFHQTLAFFRDYEDKKLRQVVGDPFEATRLFQPSGGLEIHDITQGKKFKLDMRFESSAYAEEIYVFCLSEVFSADLVNDFEAKAVVEFLKPGAFIRRWQEALPREASSFARRVAYYRPDDRPGNVWP